MLTYTKLFFYKGFLITYTSSGFLKFPKEKSLINSEQLLKTLCNHSFNSSSSSTVSFCLVLISCYSREPNHALDTGSKGMLYHHFIQGAHFSSKFLHHFLHPFLHVTNFLLHQINLDGVDLASLQYVKCICGMANYRQQCIKTRSFTWCTVLKTTFSTVSLYCLLASFNSIITLK